MTVWNKKATKLIWVLERTDAASYRDNLSIFLVCRKFTPQIPFSFESNVYIKFCPSQGRASFYIKLALFHKSYNIKTNPLNSAA